jgi:hypothetical protein
MRTWRQVHGQIAAVARAVCAEGGVAAVRSNLEGAVERAYELLWAWDKLAVEMMSCRDDVVFALESATWSPAPERAWMPEEVEF